MDSNAPRWSDVHQAGWIAARLAPWEDENTIVVPARFEAYARVLHPAETPGNGDRLVRWATPVLRNCRAIRHVIAFRGIIRHGEIGRAADP